MHCFHRIYACRKIFLDYANLFPPNDYKMNYKMIYKYLKRYMKEEASLEFRL